MPGANSCSDTEDMSLLHVVSRGRSWAEVYRPCDCPCAAEVCVKPLVPDAHYIERQDKQFSLQIQHLEVDLKLNCGFYFLHPEH